MKKDFYRKRNKITYKKTVGNSTNNYQKFKANAFTLCFGRHEMVVDDCIYPTKVDPLDFESLENTAREKLAPLVKDGLPIMVFLSGLTSAAIAVNNVCKELGLELYFLYYDKSTKAFDRVQKVA